MIGAQNEPVFRKYIAESIRLEFTNTRSLKYDIQKRMSANISNEFQDALNHIKGDNSSSYGIKFSEVTYLALAYFFSKIFSDPIKDGYYCIEMVKGFLDADNLTTYTAIHEIDVKFYKLNDDPLFKHCWLIIQSAWYFNSKYFGHHQHIDYINHYITTGDKLSINKYKYDQNYLEKKYIDIDKLREKKLPINAFSLVSQWYHCILFLVCKELDLPTDYYNITCKDNREFNPLSKTSRQLRCLSPFKIVECDIKSAFPTFLDIECGSNIKDSVYNNLMKARRITRSEAKILFNTFCNSGKFKSRKETTTFFMQCGYTQSQSEYLLALTHCPKQKFYSYMTEYESLAIQRFIFQNDLRRSGRLHDSVLFIDNSIKPKLLMVDPNCTFGWKELNRPVYRGSFSISDKRLPYAYVASIPKGLNLVTTYEEAKPAIKGEANNFIFYAESYRYISAPFNINDYTIDNETFVGRVKVMISTLYHLNKRNLKASYLYTILQHIRASSHYVFNVKALFLKIRKAPIDVTQVSVRRRNYRFSDPIMFKNRIDFILARNEAEKQVNIKINYRDLFFVLHERIANSNYDYVVPLKLKGSPRNNLLCREILKKYNFLCTGLVRKPRKVAKNEPLYNTTVKSLTLNSLSLKQQQRNAFMSKALRKHKREQAEHIEMQNNRVRAQQLFLIVCELAGETHSLLLEHDYNIQQDLKFELFTAISKDVTLDKASAVKQFDNLFYHAKKQILPVITQLTNVFENNLEKSIFNQISIEEASYRGAVFFQEYLDFNKIEQGDKYEKITSITKEVISLPEFDFDNY